MISLNGSRFTDILPENLAGQEEVQALAYAVGRQVEKLCAYADGTRIYASMDTIPGRTLDHMAAELRTPAYNENFPFEVRRALVESTMVFYQCMGTPAACNQIIKIIFGTGRIKEWWEYGGQPYHFKAHTTNPAITAENVEEFKRVLSSVKRLSSWLDEIVLDLSTPQMELCIGHWVHTGDFVALKHATL